jgi:hypothetical protein
MKKVVSQNLLNSIFFGKKQITFAKDMNKFVEIPSLSSSKLYIHFEHNLKMNKEVDLKSK